MHTYEKYTFIYIYEWQKGTNNLGNTVALVGNEFYRIINIIIVNNVS